jgi:hypothetical protein
MRSKKMAFLCCAIVATMGLLGSPLAMANGYDSCSTFNGAASVQVVAGPCPVAGPNPETAAPTGCTASGPYTGIKYRVTGSPSSIAALVTENNTVVSGGQVYPACVGDPGTGLGKYSCNEKTVVLGCGSSTATFWVVVEGKKTALPQSVALRKNSCVKSFPVLGLGTDTNPFQQVQKTETVNFKGCAVDFVFNSVTNAVDSATLNLDQSSKPACVGGEPAGTCCSEVIATDANKLKLTLDGFGDLGAGVFGEGYVSSGTNSCTTRVIGGRVYSWGSPCPE